MSIKSLEIWQKAKGLTLLINAYLGYLKQNKLRRSEPGASYNTGEDSVHYTVDLSEDSTTDVPCSRLPDNGAA